MSEMYIPPYPVHRQLIHSLCALQLHFAWHWKQAHSDESIQHILRQRVDLNRKTDPEVQCADVAKLDFARPEWLTLEKKLSDCFSAHLNDENPDAWEQEAMRILSPILENFSRKTHGGEKYKMAEYQCGSLKFDPPDKDNPEVAFFHIANAVAPASIFDDPRYLPDCLRCVIRKLRETYDGVTTLSTGTWLNEVPRWIALFPDEWQAHLSERNTNIKWGFNFWGQFIRADGSFNERKAAQLRQTGQLPLLPRESHCSLDALEKHLEVAC